MSNLKYRLLAAQLKEEQEERKNIKPIDMEQIKKEKLERQKTHKDVKPDSLLAGWFFYILVMIGGTIFVDYWVLAIFATIFFFSWRHKEIEKANGRRYDD